MSERIGTYKASNSSFDMCAGSHFDQLLSACLSIYLCYIQPFEISRLLTYGGNGITDLKGRSDRQKHQELGSSLKCSCDIYDLYSLQCRFLILRYILLIPMRSCIKICAHTVQNKHIFDQRKKIKGKLLQKVQTLCQYIQTNFASKCTREQLLK